MKFGKRDWIFVGILAVVLLIFIAISGEEKTKKLPLDATHQQFNDMLKAGKKKSEVAAGKAPDIAVKLGRYMIQLMKYRDQLVAEISVHESRNNEVDDVEDLLPPVGYLRHRAAERMAPPLHGLCRFACREP